MALDLPAAVPLELELEKLRPRGGDILVVRHAKPTPIEDVVEAVQHLRALMTAHGMAKIPCIVLGPNDEIELVHIEELLRRTVGRQACTDR